MLFQQTHFTFNHMENSYWTGLSALVIMWPEMIILPDILKFVIIQKKIHQKYSTLFICLTWWAECLKAEDKKEGQPRHIMPSDGWSNPGNGHSVSEVMSLRVTQTLTSHKLLNILFSAPKGKQDVVYDKLPVLSWEWVKHMMANVHQFTL